MPADDEPISIKLPSITDDQRRRVRAALERNVNTDYSLIRALRTPDELHQFMLNYNWNDGFGSIEAVVTHPSCDRGTALWAYWISGPMTLRYHTRDDAPDFYRDGYDIILALEKRLLANDFTYSWIRVDPRNLLATGDDVTKSNPENPWRYPPRQELMNATPGEAMPRDDLEYELTRAEKEAQERERNDIAAAGWHDPPQRSPEEQRRHDEEQDIACLELLERDAQLDSAWLPNLENFRNYLREKYGRDLPGNRGYTS